METVISLTPDCLKSPWCLGLESGSLGPFNVLILSLPDFAGVFPELEALADEVAGGRAGWMAKEGVTEEL